MGTARGGRQPAMMDVARLAGVSHQTVSRVVNDTGHVAEETRSRVLAAIEQLGPDPEITRFKGLGEISADEFKHFIGPNMRLDQVTLHKSDQVKELLEYYMGKNTMERQNFIINNLVVEEDPAEEDEEI